MKLEITKDRVLEAAAKCSQAKETLKTLFPEAFEDNKYFKFDISNPYILKEEDLPYGFGWDAIQVRIGGEYGGRGFYLTSGLNWELVEEDEHYVLIPTKCCV